MIARASSWLSLAVLGLIALMTWWLDQSVSGPGISTSTGFNGEPDFMVEQFQAVYYDADGQPAADLAAARLLHFPGSQVSLLEAPRFKQRTGGQETAEVTALQGRYDPATGVAVLSKNVIMRSNPGREGGFTARSEHLEILPDAKIIRTHLPIVVERPGMRVSATGMIANGTTREVKLLADVKGYYE